MKNHWENDFLITSQKIEEIDDVLIYEGNNIFLYSLMEHVIVSGSVSIIIIGRVYDIDNPEYDTLTIANYLQGCLNTDRFDFYLSSLSGRYLIIKIQSEQVKIYSDACALLSLYYGNDKNMKIACSSIKMVNTILNLKAGISKEVSDFLLSKKFLENNCFWIGEQSIDKRYNLLLSNHLLNFNSLTSVRRNIELKYCGLSYSDKVDKYAAMMVNGLSVIKNKDLKIPVTSGIDSRIIYAASKNISLSASYYLFDNNQNKTDIEIGSEICAIGGDKIQIIQEPIPSKDFINNYKKLFYYVTEDDRIAHYFYHSIHDEDRINVNGNGGDIIRGYYDYYNMNSAQSIIKYLGYKDNRLFDQTIKRWMDGLEKNDIVNHSDLLYWEQKTSNWFGRYQYEKNFFIRDYSPYCNYSLIMLGFSVPHNKRRAYKNTFQIDVISALYPKLRDIPINPEAKILGKLKLKSYQYHAIWKIINRVRKSIF